MAVDTITIGDGVKINSVDVSIFVMLRKTADNTELTGTVYTGVTGSYVIMGAARTAITMATQTVTGAHSDGGFVEVDSTNCPGLYRFDIPDAAWATAGSVVICVKVASAYVVIREFIVTNKTTSDLNDAVTAPTAAQVATQVWQDLTSGSDFAGTAATIGHLLTTSLPNLAPGAAGGLFIAGSNAATTVNFTGNLSGSVGSVTTGVTVTTNNDKSGYSLTVAPPTAAAIATAVWTDLTTGSDFTGTSKSIGILLTTALPNLAPGASGGLFIAGSNAATTVNITGNITGNVTGSVGSVTGAVGSVTGSVGSVTGLTNASIATQVWTDLTTGSDFAGTPNSIGHLLTTCLPNYVVPGAAGGLFIAGSNASTTVNFTGNLSGSVGSVTGLTTATIATAVWQDTTAGDFTVTSSPGKILVTQLGGAFTTTSSSVFSTASLANGPSGGGGGPTAAQIATAVWGDLTTGSDFAGTPSSIGHLLTTVLPNYIAPGAANGLLIAGSNAATTVNITGNITGNLTGTIGDLAAGAQSDVAGAVWNAVMASYETSGTTGAQLATAAAGGDPWAVSLTGTHYGAGTAGYLIGQLTLSAIATSVWTDLTTGSDFATSLSIGKLLVTALPSFIAPGASGGIFIAGSNAATSLPSLTTIFTGNLTGTVSTVTGNVQGNVIGTVGDLAAACKTDVAAAVWNAAAATYNTSGTFGQFLNTLVASSGADPWLTSLTGTHYGVGSAGYILGNLIAEVWDTARSSHTIAGSFGEGVASVQGNVTGNVNGSTGSVTVVSDKLGYSLSATGLDTVSSAQPVGTRPANFREYLMWMCRRFTNKHVADSGALTLTVYKDDGATVLSIQPFVETATVQTVNATS